MTHLERSGEMTSDPDGSIFLPKTAFPEQEFEAWYFQLMLGRGIGRNQEPEEILRLHEELETIRAQHIGRLALEG